MAGLADLIPSPGDGVSVRVGRVISVSGHVLQVDLAGPVQVLATDDCNPRPNDNVVVLQGSGNPVAVGVIGSPYRQSTLIVTATTSTTVTGLINGASQTIPKSGTFTVATGDVCPLFWSADGSRVWCLPNEQQATAPPTGGGSGGGGAPPPVQSGTSVYAPTQAGTWYSSGHWTANSPIATSGSEGAFFYGGSRFRELQGRTITAGRVYLPGSGAPTIWGHPHPSFPAGAPSLAYNGGARGIGGWVGLPVGLLNYLISGTGTGGLAFTGSAVISTPSGQIEFSWRK